MLLFYLIFRVLEIIKYHQLLPNVLFFTDSTTKLETVKNGIIERYGKKTDSTENNELTNINNQTNNIPRIQHASIINTVSVMKFQLIFIKLIKNIV